MDIAAAPRVKNLESCASSRRRPLVKISSVSTRGLKELKDVIVSMLGVESS